MVDESSDLSYCAAATYSVRHTFHFKASQTMEAQLDNDDMDDMDHHETDTRDKKPLVKGDCIGHPFSESSQLPSYQPLGTT